MSGKKPTTIFTDQDAAMSAAIPKVLPETYHALCSWHMWQNANRHLGYLLKGESRFNKDFLACIYGYDDEEKQRILSLPVPSLDSNRNSSSPPFSPLWFASLFTELLASIWLGVFIFQNQS